MNAIKLALLCAALLALGVSPARADKTEKIEQLVNLHDLKTSVAVGDFYLKQQALLAVRGYLARIGKEQGLGSQWNPANPYWKDAEDTLMRSMMKEVNRKFSNLEWLSEEWTDLDRREFSEQDIDLLLEHLKTDVGRKQVMIVDHGVSVHVMGALTFTGKLQYELQGTEAERARMQELYNAEDDAMRFDISENPEGTRFAMSKVGKRYFVNTILKVSGMISRRIDQTAAALPAELQTKTGEAQTAVEAFRKAKSG
jgi:hypothetical protein